MVRLSRRAGGLDQSITLAIDAKAKALIAQGEKVIKFGAGEPDFDTPQHIKDAARKALEGRIGTYTPVFLTGVESLVQPLSVGVREEDRI